MWAIFDGSFDSMSWGLKCLLPNVNVGSFDWGLKCLPLYRDFGSFEWGLKCLPLCVDVGFRVYTIGLHCIPIVPYP